MIRKVSKYSLIFFFLAAGVNHFFSPEFYYPLIPDYLVFPKFINMISGILELLFAMMLFFERTQKIAIYGLLILLIAFIPAHIHFISLGSCVPEGLCVAPWIAWFRLVLIHPLIMLWVWSIKDSNTV